ncbi:MAG: ABC-2 transporter permease [Fusicatenibacter sp.]|nr:ABC-2 transporter permease [Fusicatenibacter sp.]
MSGLLQKDLCLLLQRSQILIVLVGVGVLMGFSTEGSFVIGYMTMLCAILTIGTISYDEFDNGYPFLFTLPITKKSYVLSKYLFCLIGSLAGWGVSAVIYVICSVIRGNGVAFEDVLDTLAFLPVFGLIIAVMLPIQLKFGAEKSRVVLAVAAGGIFALGYLGRRFLPKDLRIPAFILNAGDAVILVMLLAVSVAALLISCQASVHIMNKKEY